MATFTLQVKETVQGYYYEVAEGQALQIYPHYQAVQLAYEEVLKASSYKIKWPPEYQHRFVNDLNAAFIALFMGFPVEVLQ